MEYVYAAMLLHKAGKEINEVSVKKVLEAGGIHADDAKVKALCASLQSVNIDDAIKNASIAAAPAPVHEEKKEHKKEEKKEEKKDDGQAAAGLGALFG